MSTDTPAGSDEQVAAGSTVPPYEGRREDADIDPQEESRKDEARVGGATGPVADPSPKAPEPAETERGATASPADEQPADQMSEVEDSDPGVGPAHTPGTPRGEDLGDSG
jgi:hypothetical protein